MEVIILSSILFMLGSFCFAQKEIYLSFLDCNELIKEKLISDISSVYSLKIKEVKTLTDVEFAYNPKRKQYLAREILDKIKSFVPKNALVLVLVIDKDLYEEGFNYIFGQATDKVSVVSIYRFKPCSEVDTLEEKILLTERTTKTIIHEIGHCLGLFHCSNPSCVMYFSNWVGDTDKKSKNFCEVCGKKISSFIKNRKVNY